MKKIVLSCLLFLLLPFHLAFCESKIIQSQPGLVEIRLPENLDSPEVDVSWEARQPIDLQYKTYEGDTVLVFYLGSGQAAVQSDVIHWTERKREKTTWIVRIGSDPVPPDPDPTPNPPGPVPDSVDNRMDVGRDVYLSASKLGDKNGSKILAEQLEGIANGIHGGLIVPREANDIAQRAIDKVPGWTQFSKDLANIFRKSLEKHGVGLRVYRDIYHEASLALRAYANGDI